MKKNLVTIIIPTYNRAKYIVKAIDSCFQQTYKEIEVIVVDDGSTDNTRFVIDEMAIKYGPHRLKYFCQEKGGVSKARNRGVEQAAGEFIQFLDSDDYLRDIKLENQVTAITQAAFPVAVCDYMCVSNDDPPRVFEVNYAVNLKERLARFDCVNIGTLLFRADTIRGKLVFETSFSWSEDLDFLIKYFLKIKKWTYTPGLWCLYVRHDEARLTREFMMTHRPYKQLFFSTYYYWHENRKNIPRENDWMVRNYAASIFKLMWATDKINAARVAYFALGFPLSIKRYGNMFWFVFRPFIPSFMMTIARHLKRELKT